MDAHVVTTFEEEKGLKTSLLGLSEFLAKDLADGRFGAAHVTST